MGKKILLLLTLVAVIFLICSCQTVKGLGDDIKSVGEAGEEVLQGD